MKNPIFFDFDDGEYSPSIHYFYIKDNSFFLGEMEGTNKNELYLFHGLIYHAVIAQFCDVQVVVSINKLN